MPMQTGERISYDVYMRLMEKTAETAEKGEPEQKQKCKDFLTSIKVINPYLVNERSSMHKAGLYARIPEFLDMFHWTVKDLYAEFGVEISWFNNEPKEPEKGNDRPEKLANMCLSLEENARKKVLYMANELSPDWWKGLPKKPTARCISMITRYWDRVAILRGLGLPVYVTKGEMEQSAYSEVEITTVLAIMDRKGYTRLPTEALPRVSAYLGISLQWLMALDDEDYNNSVPVYTDDKITDAILTAYGFMGTIGRHTMDKAVEQLAEGGGAL